LIGEGMGFLAMPLPKTSKSVSWQKKSGQLCRFCLFIWSCQNYAGNRKNPEIL